MRKSGENIRLGILLIPAFCCLFEVVVFAASKDGVKTLRLAPAEHMTRAELHYVETVPTPRAALILCPGVNGSGEGLVRSAAWRSFAQKEKLGLIGLSFASPIPAIHEGTGYYYVSKGSGEVLLQGIRQIFGRDLPLILYGFSGGAHFTSRFTEWKPDRVLTWCAYSAGWWDEPKSSDVAPPGIVACGDADYRFGASLIYFKQGRAAGKPWLWISLGGVDHVRAPELDEFVKNYFSTILANRRNDGLWVDMDMKAQMTKAEADKHPSLSGWLPHEHLLKEWGKIHSP